ncbi:MAG: ribosome silencing factor [Microbacteriaceae bacterium]|jgi:ribosome-associated protein|nr:ribosome silencing factor [Microbacteriaceae bacterium]MCI1207129.1 ribosome silencing factor [Microbacteriaceae bacterium]
MGLPEETREAVDLIVATALQHGASEPVVLDVSGSTPFTDAFIVLTVQTARTADALADRLIEALRPTGVRLRASEGRETGTWVLLDFGLVVVHLFLPEQREFYALERVWREAPVIPVAETLVTATAGGESA